MPTALQSAILRRPTLPPGPIRERTPEEEAAIRARQRGTSAETFTNAVDLLLGALGLADEGTAEQPNRWARGGALLAEGLPLIGMAAKGKRGVQAIREAILHKFDPRFAGLNRDPRAGELERMADLRTTFDPRPMPEVPVRSLTEYVGRPVILTQADRVRAGGQLTHINDVPLTRPVNLQGGKDYPFDITDRQQAWPPSWDPEQAWANAFNEAQGIHRTAQALERKTGQRPIVLPFRMGPKGSDFSRSTAEVMLSFADSVFGAKAKERRALNTAMKAIVPDWAGLGTEQSWRQLERMSALQRTAAQQMMDRMFRDQGGLSLGEARLAIADPAQLTAPQAGLDTIAEVFPDRPLIMQSGHPSYPVGIPGRGLARVKEPNLNALRLLPSPEAEQLNYAMRGTVNGADIDLFRRLQVMSASPELGLTQAPVWTTLTESVLRNLGY